MTKVHAIACACCAYIAAKSLTHLIYITDYFSPDISDDENMELQQLPTCSNCCSAPIGTSNRCGIWDWCSLCDYLLWFADLYDYWSHKSGPYRLTFHARGVVAASPHKRAKT